MLTDNEYSSYSDVDTYLVFHGTSDGKESACNEGNLDLIPGLGRFPGGGYGNPLQYSCLENPHGPRSLADSMGLQRVRHN